jgi:hypothetical protein
VRVGQGKPSQYTPSGVGNVGSIIWSDFDSEEIHNAVESYSAGLDGIRDLLFSGRALLGLKPGE